MKKTTPSKSWNEFLKVNLRKKKLSIKAGGIPLQTLRIVISKSVDTTEAIKFGKQCNLWPQ